MRPTQSSLNVAFTGHVDHGKSTLIGKLLLESGHIDTHEYSQYEREAEEKNRSDAALAFISDDRKEERERGLSIKPSYSQLAGSKYNFTLIDCPGHHYYTSNMVKGVSQSDAAVLVVSAKDGIQPLTKEHALISRVMGGGDIVVAVSKMDTVDYSENQFTQIKEETRDLLETIYQDGADASFVPVSAIEGRNVVADGTDISWYEGKSLLEELNALSEPEPRSDILFRLPVDERQTMSGIGTTVTGTVRTGAIKPGEKVVFEPSGTECEVRSIEMFHEKIGRAAARDNIGMGLTGVTSASVEPGDVGGRTESPPSTTKEITAQVTAVQKPPEIKPGVKLVFHAHSLQSPCEITGVSFPDEPDDRVSQMEIVKPGETGQVHLQFPEQIAVERHEGYPSLGSFLLRDNNETLAYGEITAIE
jgi:elongation factor 1-alpha